MSASTGAQWLAHPGALEDLPELRETERVGADLDADGSDHHGTTPGPSRTAAQRRDARATGDA